MTFKTWEEVRATHVRLVDMQKEPDPFEAALRALAEFRSAMEPYGVAVKAAVEAFHDALDEAIEDPRCPECGRTWPEEH